MKIKNLSNTLIIATILISVVRYMGAFASADLGKITGWLSDVFTFFLTLSGLGMGILEVLGGGLLFNGWRYVMPKAGQRWSFRFWVLTLCVFGLIVSGMIIIVPFTISRMTQETIVDALGGKDSGFTWLWATMVVAVPYLLIAGVFIGNRMVERIESNAQVSEKVSMPTEKVTRNLPADWRKIRPTLTDEQVDFLARSAPREIVLKLGESGINISPRTASNWHLNAMRELGMFNNQP